MPQFLIHEFKIWLQFDLIDQFLSSNIKDTVYYPNVSHVYIYFTIQRFIFLRSSMFWAISYYSIVQQLSIHIYLLFNFPDAIFRLSSFMQTLQLLLFPCHEPTTIQYSIVLSHCGSILQYILNTIEGSTSRHLLWWIVSSFVNFLQQQLSCQLSSNSYSGCRPTGYIFRTQNFITGHYPATQ